MKNEKSHCNDAVNVIRDLMKSKTPLSMHDFWQEIFKEQILAGEIHVLDDLVKHTYASSTNEYGKIIKNSEYENAYDYIVKHVVDPTDARFDELFVITVYTDIHSDIKTIDKDKFRENPVFDKRYQITRYELRVVRFNRAFPKEYYVTSLKVD